MDNAAGEDEIVMERETAAPSAGAPGTKKRKRAAAAGVKASGTGMCDDVLPNILARLPARSALASMMLSKRHHSMICSPEFRTLHCRLGAPLPRPHIAYVATAAIRRRPEHDPVSVFHAFHIAGGGTTTTSSSNKPMRVLTGGRYRDTKLVNTCNGVVLLASKKFSYYQCKCTCTLWNPAVADELKAVTLADSSSEGGFLVLGLGYGRRSDTYKILLCRKEATRSHSHGGSLCCGYGKCRVKYRLLSHNLGNGKTEPLTTVVTMALEEETKERSLYLDGTIYLLLEKSAILAFDVDDETVATIGLPSKWRYKPDDPWNVAPQLFQMSGRPCVAANHKNRWALWMLTLDRQWEQRCAIADGYDPVRRLHKYPLAGVWDCGDMLMLLFDYTASLCLYHVPTAKMFVTILPGGLVPKGSDYALCWDYMPTLVSPRSILLNRDEELCHDLIVDAVEVLNPVREQERKKGQEATLDTVCFMKFLVSVMRKLPDDVRDVVKMPLLIDSEDPIFFSERVPITDSSC